MNTLVNLKQDDIKQQQDALRDKINMTGKTVTIRRPVVNQNQISVALSGRLNEKFIALMDEMARFKTKRGDHIRARAYQKARESLSMYPDEITHLNYTDLDKLPGIGETLIKKFREYVTTGELQALEREKMNPQNVFTEIYGVGAKAAQKLIDEGITSLDALREKSSEVLNEKQQIGLKYYDDILERIPREEIDVYLEKFNEIFDIVKSADAKFEIGGSYRRGVRDSGDIDVIVTADQKSVFKDFMDKLIEENIIIELLSRGPVKSLTITKLDDHSIARRVDFLYTTPDEYPFAVLYFTGSKNFNTAMRAHALSMGYSLNEHGIYNMSGKKKGDKVDQSFSNEESIFGFLNMEYVVPSDRIDRQSVKLIAISSMNNTTNNTTLKKGRKQNAKTLKMRDNAKQDKVKQEKEDAKREKEERRMMALKEKEDAKRERRKEKDRHLKIEKRSKNVVMQKH